jgi:hypothetical protein
MEQLLLSVLTTPSVTSALGAFAIGMIGSAAYAAALWLGLMTLPSSNPFLMRLLQPRGQILFTFFGGSIAMVFQAAQGPNLAPIQALVLGITWPTIVSHYHTEKAGLAKVPGAIPSREALDLAVHSNAVGVYVQEGDNVGALTIEQLETAVREQPHEPIQNLPAMLEAMSAVNRFLEIREAASTDEKREEFEHLRELLGKSASQVEQESLAEYCDSSNEGMQLIGLSLLYNRHNKHDIPYLQMLLSKNPRDFEVFITLDLLEQLVPELSKEETRSLSIFLQGLRLGITPGGRNEQKLRQLVRMFDD